jgi:hypothetical protein
MRGSWDIMGVVSLKRWCFYNITPDGEKGRAWRRPAGKLFLEAVAISLGERGKEVISLRPFLLISRADEFFLPVCAGRAHWACFSKQREAL